MKEKLWKVLKKNFPKISNAVPVGKKDMKGNIIRKHDSLKHLYLQTYLNRLRNRPIKPGMEEIRKLKMELFNLRLRLSKMNRSQPWTMTHLDKAIKCLKKIKPGIQMGS